MENSYKSGIGLCLQEESLSSVVVLIPPPLLELAYPPPPPLEIAKFNEVQECQEKSEEQDENDNDEDKVNSSSSVNNISEGQGQIQDGDSEDKKSEISDKHGEGDTIEKEESTSTSGGVVAEVDKANNQKALLMGEDKEEDEPEIVEIVNIETKQSKKLRSRRRPLRKRPFRLSDKEPEVIDIDFKDDKHKDKEDNNISVEVVTLEHSNSDDDWQSKTKTFEEREGKEGPQQLNKPTEASLSAVSSYEEGEIVDEVEQEPPDIKKKCKKRGKNHKKVKSKKRRRKTSDRDPFSSSKPVLEKKSTDLRTTIVAWRKSSKRTHNRNYRDGRSKRSDEVRSEKKTKRKRRSVRSSDSLQKEKSHQKRRDKAQHKQHRTEVSKGTSRRTSKSDFRENENEPPPNRSNYGERSHRHREGKHRYRNKRSRSRSSDHRNSNRSRSRSISSSSRSRRIWSTERDSSNRHSSSSSRSRHHHHSRHSHSPPSFARHRKYFRVASRSRSPSPFFRGHKKRRRIAETSDSEQKRKRSQEKEKYEKPKKKEIKKKKEKENVHEKEKIKRKRKKRTKEKLEESPSPSPVKQKSKSKRKNKQDIANEDILNAKTSADNRRTAPPPPTGIFSPISESSSIVKEKEIIEASKVTSSQDGSGRPDLHSPFRKEAIPPTAETNDGESDSLVTSSSTGDDANLITMDTSRPLDEEKFSSLAPPAQALRVHVAPPPPMGVCLPPTETAPFVSLLDPNLIVSVASALLIAQQQQQLNQGKCETEGTSPISPNPAEVDELFEPPSTSDGSIKKGKGSKNSSRTQHSRNSDSTPKDYKPKNNFYFSVPAPPAGNPDMESLFDSLFGTPHGTDVKQDKDDKPGKDEGTTKAPGKENASSGRSAGGELTKGNSLRIINANESPTSAVDLNVKQKYLSKLNRQERVAEEVKKSLKPHYDRKQVTKEEYKQILRKAVPKICHKSKGINPVKVKQLVEAYVKKLRSARARGIEISKVR